jgi:single-strand DNA-binding protein
MAGVNRAIILGNVGKDPQISTMQSGEKVAKLSIATSESWKDKNTGERREKTEWHNVVIFGQLAKIVESYVKKGSKLYIEGKLQTRKWTDSKDGVEKYTTEIVLQGFNCTLALLDSRQDTAPSAHDTAKANAYQPSDDLDDDILF